MAKVQFSILGTFVLTVNGEVCEEFRSVKARALLAYLALEGKRPVLRSHLADLLWQGYERESAYASLRVALSNLRQVLLPLPIIRATRQLVQFNPDHPDFWCDALALSKAAPGQASANDIDGLPDNSQAILLPGFEAIDSPPFRNWLQQRREHYEQLLAHLRRNGQEPVKQTPLRPVPLAAPKPVPPAAEHPASTQPPAQSLPQTLDEERYLIPDPGAFYGRQAELDQLKRWVVNERSRLVAILGIGGQGKTALAAHLARLLIAPRPSLRREYL
jgi:hypothetical protein